MGRWFFNFLNIPIVVYASYLGSCYGVNANLNLKRSLLSSSFCLSFSFKFWVSWTTCSFFFSRHSHIFHCYRCLVLHPWYCCLEFNIQLSISFFQRWHITTRVGLPGKRRTLVYIHVLDSKTILIVFDSMI